MTFENESCLSKIPDSSVLNVMWRLDGQGVWGRMDTCICESLRCPPETITALLVGYTPI